MSNIVRDLVQPIVQRADSWINAMTGLGTLRDKVMHTQVAPGMKLTDPVLEALFNDDDVAQRIINRLPRDATRRGFRIEITERSIEGRSDADDGETEPDDADEYESPTARRGAEHSEAQAVADQNADIERLMLLAFAKLEGMPKLRDGWIWARLYGGGSGIFVGADDGQQVDQPLNEDAIRTIKFLNIVKRPQLSIHTRYEDIREDKYGKPELYLVNQAAAGQFTPREGLVVHESRLILFDGSLTARMTIESPTGFDDSVLQKAYAPLQQTAAAWQSLAHLLTDASQGVLKIANLVDLVATGGTETLRARIQLMDLARSVCRSILVDAEKESFERVATSFAGLPEVMDRLMQRMCAAAEQPATLLYGRSPAGMNATGESDIRGWYDTVAEGQTDELKPRLERLLRLMFLAKDSPTRGAEPESWCIEFNPLWLPTDKEVADTKKVKADTYVALVGGNIMTDAEAGIGLAPDFPEIDVDSRTELAEADAEEGVRPREVNAPEPVPLDPNDPEGGGGGGGGGGAAGGGAKAKAKPKPKAKAKARGDSGELRVEDSNQPRVPAGSPQGGQWTSGGGGGGGAAMSGASHNAQGFLVLTNAPKKQPPAARASLTESQRLGIHNALRSAQQSLSADLVRRYGVPAKQAAILWERDIKAQLKAAKGRRAELRAAKRAAEAKVTEALAASKAAMNKAITAKNAADAARAAAAAAAAKAKPPAPPKPRAKGKGKTGPTVDDITTAKTPKAARGVATQLVQDYLGETHRPAIGTSVTSKNLKHKGWAGYNSGGDIVLDKAVAARLKSGRKLATHEEIEALEAKRMTAFNTGTLREARELGDEIRAATAHRSAVRTLVHEELHSFGPIARANRLYRGQGVVAEEVTTEVLAREIVGGKSGRAIRGSYQTQIDGVLSAMRDSRPQWRDETEHYDVLVKAARSYKKSAEVNVSAMDQLHEHILKHDSSYDSGKLRANLATVPLPPHA